MTELPQNITDETPVVVTFLKASRIDLQARGIGVTQAADLRVRLATFAEDWNTPEMDIYDNYDAAKANL
ncbi:MAG: hypothetical protein NTY86_04590 [Deltaproteobacteria bacterium]|nr:hypothetical protein [Deltaproteobacteria bacterium]